MNITQINIISQIQVKYNKHSPLYRSFHHYIQISIYSLMNHQKKLRNIVLQLPEHHKIQFLHLYAKNLPNLSTHVKKISFNCHESTLQINNHIYNGYGKTHNEALIAGINMLLQAHIKNQANHQSLKEALKKLSVHAPQQTNNDKIKTQPDILIDKNKVELVGRTSFGSTKPKENPVKPQKSIKQQIFESLNRSCFKKGEQHNKNKLITQTLSKQPSYALLGQVQGKNIKKQQIESILNRVRQLQQKLSEALNENQYLKKKLQQKQNKQKELIISSYNQKQNTLMKEDDHQVHKKKETTFIYREPKEVMEDITNKISNILQTKENYKLRSFSMTNSTNNSNFNSKIESKVKIPKLNLEILPNYHGKSNKSLNQSLLQNYQKKMKVNNYV